MRHYRINAPQRRRSTPRRRGEGRLPARYVVAVAATATVIAALVYAAGVTGGPALSMPIGFAAIALLLYVSFANGETPRPSWRSRWHHPDRLLDAWTHAVDSAPPRPGRRARGRRRGRRGAR